MAPEMLSMQAVADVLGVDRKALNYHVGDRETLLGLIAQESFASSFSGVEIAAHADWREACRTYGRGYAQAVIVTGSHARHLPPHHALSGRFLVTTESLLLKLTEAGFDDETAVRSLALLTNICHAFARDAETSRTNPANTRINLLLGSLSSHGEAAFPNLSRITESGIDTYGDEQLDFAIETCIAGMAARLGSATE